MEVAEERGREKRLGRRLRVWRWRRVVEEGGVMEVVEVGEDGCFAWNAQRFKSLSHTARAITGYNVSGFKFFGVKP